IPEALGMIGAASGLRLPSELRTTVDSGERAALQVAAAIRALFDGLVRLLEEALPSAGAGDDVALGVTAGLRAGSAWQELEHTWAEGLVQLQALERAVVEITAELESLPDAGDAVGDLGSELGSHLDYWHEARRRLNGCLHTPEPGMVHWIAGGGRFRAAWLNAAPLEVARLLRERLFARPESSVLVSATLAIGGSFDYVRRRLGLEEAASQALG